MKKSCIRMKMQLNKLQRMEELTTTLMEEQLSIFLKERRRRRRRRRQQRRVGNQDARVFQLLSTAATTAPIICAARVFQLLFAAATTTPIICTARVFQANSVRRLSGFYARRNPSLLLQLV
ncbi:hypothetical protein Adt_03071 [Abeliophyllum distichum]|uniref:Uncharacterized protein n=1 Tax=Abeliophyllum distichum TaxID=126358 RepID=A0ABD1VZL9_9LAMI